MKREFGKKLIETYIPRWDLTHVIDTSVASIPGHGTPTVILFGRHRTPIASQPVRAVLGIKGKPTTSEERAQGIVWRAIVDQIDRPGSSSDFISVSDTDRTTFQTHPWSIGGGGAAELKEQIDSRATNTLGNHVDAISSVCITREDDAYLLGRASLTRFGVSDEYQVISVEGDRVRDWSLHDPNVSLFPYDSNLQPVSDHLAPAVHRVLWPYKEYLWRRKELGGDHRQLGRTWWEWNRFLSHRFTQPLSIAFAFVATHNHFVFDRGGKVFNRSAPVIKLKPGATEQDYLLLLGLLNSSTACFWLKEVCHSKGAQGVNEGAKAESWERFIEISVGALADFPLPQSGPLTLATRLDRICSPPAVDPSAIQSWSKYPDELECAEADWKRRIGDAIAVQEDLDWQCYGSYGLVDATEVVTGDGSPSIRLGERAFEIVMARKMAAGELETAWFERHASTPMTDLPADWPESYRQVVEQRIELIESHPAIALVEQPEYKRRWNIEPWDEQVERALRGWLLDRLESPDYWSELMLASVARLGDRARQDADFMRVAALYRGQDTFDVSALVGELVDDEAVPFLPSQRYKPSGLRKREAWERTWALQRQEDAIDARLALPQSAADRLSEADVDDLKQREVGTIPVPPKYKSSDFKKSSYWRLRGKLDVPKERFISYPGCERDADPTLVIGWAGWDNLQQAKALATFYVQMKESEGWTAERLRPLLAGVQELLPWLKQWHNEIDREYGTRMGDYYEGFVAEELRSLGFAHGSVDS